MHAESLDTLKARILKWASQFEYCCFLDSCKTQTDSYGEYEFLLGLAGKEAPVHLHPDQFCPGDGNWYFGHFAYELKDHIERGLVSQNMGTIKSPQMRFFKAEIVLGWKKSGENGQELEFLLGDKNAIREELDRTSVSFADQTSEFSFKSNFSREKYLKTIQTLREHIKEGDVYEINLCQEYSAQGALIDPPATFRRLVEISPTPFAAYLRLADSHVICASPERFLRLQNQELITQPIKGTAPRGNNPEQDLQFRQELVASEKERAENVMIVDLARNDLNRSAETNSVSVPHLFEIQTFPKVHHLVSTVSAKLSENTSPLQAILNAFPPGSMTGAPKIRAMELIEKYESSARGIYSGSIGYFDPIGDFDLNVVIRTLIFDEKENQLSYHVGGAITWGSDSEAEYEETLLKKRALDHLLNS